MVEGRQSSNSQSGSCGSARVMMEFTSDERHGGVTHQPLPALLLALHCSALQLGLLPPMPKMVPFDFFAEASPAMISPAEGKRGQGDR